MKATNKIDAIRILRNLPLKVEERVSDNGIKFQAVLTDISLFAAKELVESIMVLESNDHTFWKNKFLQAEQDIEVYKQRIRDLEFRYKDLTSKIHNLIPDDIQF
jgi:hypothetical protein